MHKRKTTTAVQDGETKTEFWSHLEELRGRLLFCFFMLAALSVFCYFVSDSLIGFLTRPLSLLGQKTYFLSPYDAFLVKLKVSLLSSLFFVSPLLITEMWLFIAPALYEKEKRIFWVILLSSISLFTGGLCLAIFYVVPIAVRFFLGFSTPMLAPLISIDKYLNFVSWMSLGFGTAFQTPVLTVGLVRLGVVEVRQLRAARPFVIAGVFIFSALLTPPDPLSQCLLAFPLWFLYEASLFVSALGKSRRKTTR